MRKSLESSRPIVFSSQLDDIEKELKEHEKYKAIEKELGIDLLTLFKALKNGIWTKKGHIEGENLEIHFYQKLLSYMWESDDENDVDFINFHFKDYGKTWALTKEELE